jgi:hypothetical protein
MSKVVMVGEEHYASKRKIGRAVKDRIKKLKPEKFAILAEGPFFTPEEKALLAAEVFYTPTAGILKFFKLIRGEEFDKMIAGWKRAYLEEKELGDYREHIENIESSVFTLVPRLMGIGLIDKIDDYEKKTLETFVSMLKTLTGKWRSEKAEECAVLDDYAYALGLTLRVRKGLYYLENPPRPVNLFELSKDEVRNIESVFSSVPSDMLDDILAILSTMHSTFGMRSGLHADKITELVDKGEHDLILTVTGAAHIPDVLYILSSEERLHIIKEIVFTDSSHEEYARKIREIDPDITVSFFNVSP